MRTHMGFSSWPAALVSAIGLAGCAPETDYSTLSTSPVTMVCDGGKTFAVSYTNGFETAIIETEGRRLELQKVRTSLGMNPTPGLGRAPGFSGFGTDRDSTRFGSQAFPPGVDPGGGGPSVAAAGTTGVRYSGDDGYYLSRNRAAVLQVGDENYSNCEVAR
jgi:hypothetical protein